MRHPAVEHTGVLRVALDVSHTRLSSAGTARYATELGNALAARNDVQLTLLGAGPPAPRSARVGRYATVLSHDIVWYPLRGRPAAERAGADVYHIPVTRGPITQGSVPTVVTVHDLVPWLYPDSMSGWNRMYTRRFLGRIARAADAVVCVSQSTADDVNRLLGVPAERVHVAHNGVSEFWFGSAAPVNVDDDAYVLFVGTPEPRKNLARLLEAMLQLHRRGRTERLVIVGGEGWGTEMSQRRRRVTLVGRASDSQLRDLYAGAACVALPSLHEGFGLPALEAMAAGTPVVVSRAGGLPEVCGAAGVYVDPTDPGSIADGLEAAIGASAHASAERAERIARARQFTWERAAKSVIGVYRKLS